MMTGSLHGHIALVTGGSRGIGAAIVRSLAEAGATVAVNFHERAREADTLVKAISEADGHAIAIAADRRQRPRRDGNRSSEFMLVQLNLLICAFGCRSFKVQRCTRSTPRNNETLSALKFF